MALVKYGGDDSVLENLRSQFASLDSELSLLQNNYQKLRQAHGKKCSTALSEATTSLLCIIKYVSKADKTLIYWHAEGTTLKTALRLVGMDKRTDAIAEKKLQKIKAKTATTEVQFTRTSEVFMDGLKAIQTLDTQISQYSISSLGSARAQTSKAHEQADTNAKFAELSMQKAKVKRSTAQSELDDIPSQIDSVGGQRQRAQEMSDSTGAFAFGSGAVAAVAGLGSFLFPPLAMIALPAAGLAASNTVASCVYDSQVDQLRTRETQLASQISSLQSQIESLESQIPQLDQARTSYIQTKARISELATRGEALQSGSQMILESLLQAQILLSGLQMKIRSVAISLAECGYFETRREIATTLREIVDDLGTNGSGSSSGKGMAAVLGNNSNSYSYNNNSGIMARISRKVAKVESRTARVAMVMGK